MLPPLPHATSKLIGRSRELAELGRVLPGTRLLTLTGPGGAGKTALGLALARHRTRNIRESGVFLDLSLLTAAEHVPRAQAVAAEIANSRCLLVVDNCEHLIDAAAELVRALLECCPALTVLATSRERLGVAGEVVWSVPPLLTAAAVALFTVRARERRADFEVIGRDREAVDAICQRLEGVPLAIELAAARSSLLSPAEILTRLDDRLTLLGGEPRAVARQRSLRATLDWSYGLLEEGEQRLFRTLSVFAGFDLDAVERVTGPSAIPLLGRLVDKSLVNRVAAARAGYPARYTMLETVREYARDRLAGAGETDSVYAAHLQCFARRAEEAYTARTRSGSVQLLQQLQIDLDNLRTALTWAVEHAPCTGLELIGSSREVWFWVDQREGLACARALLEACPERSRARALALLTAGQLSSTCLEHGVARQQLHEATQLAADLGDAHIQAAASWILGVDAFLAQEHERAREYLDESVCLHQLVGDKVGGGIARSSLGTAELRLGNVEVAIEHLQSARDQLFDTGDPWGSGFACTYLGIALLAAGRRRAASERLLEGLRILAPTGEVTMLTVGIEGLAELAAGVDWSRALQLAAAASALRARLAGPFPPWIAASNHALHQRGRQAVGIQAADREWERGSRLSRTEAVVLATGMSPQAPVRTPLSARETEVAALVADGISNAQIAVRLGLSRRTAENHLTHILGKLGLSNRTQIATWYHDRARVSSE